MTDELGFGEPEEEVRIVSSTGYGIFTTNDDPNADPTDVGYGAGLRRFDTAGVYNSDFYQAPADADATITAANYLPYWLWTQSSGTAITASSLADATAGSGRILRFAMASGAAGDDAYFQQIVPINAAQGQNFGYAVVMTPSTPTPSGSRRGTVYVAAQYLTKALATTGSSAEDSWDTSAGIIGSLDQTAVPNGTGAVPTDAYYLRIRIGYRRGTAATTDTGVVYVHEVRSLPYTTEVAVVDGGAPTTYARGLIKQTSGVMIVTAPNLIALNQYRIAGADISFPVSPQTDSRFTRTDRNIEYFYDGTRWLSTTLYHLPIAGYTLGIGPYTTTGVKELSTLWGGTDMWLESAIFTANVAAPSDAANYWTLRVQKRSSTAAVTALADYTTDAITAGQWGHTIVTIGALMGTTMRTVEFNVTAKTGLPGNLQAMAAITYRLVG